MKQSATDVVVNLGSLVTAAYHLLPVTPENTRAVRTVAWGLLANVLISDYLNRWNEAEAADIGESQVLLDKAIVAVEKALKRDPEFALAHYAKGLIHRAAGEHQLASDRFDLAISYNPNLVRAYAQKGGALLNLGKLDEALKQIDKAIKLGPGDPSIGMFHWHRGRVLFFQGNNYDEAIKSFKTAVRHRPNLWYTWLYLISAYALSDLPDGPDLARQKLEEFKTTSPIPNAREFTITLVESYEESNRPDANNATVTEGRKKFHEGLKIAKMDP
jgi:tetratricopeptide (TPR) repeat protein